MVVAPPAGRPVGSVPPAVVIAAPGSGEGKTTVATGLMAALADRGLRVAPFKVGPDYIDPGYHGLATGRPGRNLDPLMCGEGRIAPLYAHGAAGCDIAVVEGVMGLFDGRVIDGAPQSDAPAPGSTAHVARLVGAPVVLVLDASGLSQTAAAVIRGLATHDPQTVIAGVVFNRVGSSRHAAILAAACEAAGVPALGMIHRDADVAVPSRHLGLVTAAEHSASEHSASEHTATTHPDGSSGGAGEDAATSAVRRMARVVAEGVDLDAVLAAARATCAPDPWDPGAEVAAVRESDGAGPGEGEAPVVAVARGRAFTFVYPEYEELLEAAGARVVGFDPLTAEALPPGTAALVLPGGFPEEHAAALAANAALRAEIGDRVREGTLCVHAECAGLLYLCTDLEPREGPAVPMCGVLEAHGRFTPRLTLGYRDAVSTADSLLFRAGERVTGHEFHRTAVTLTPPVATDVGGGPTDRAPVPAWAWRDWRGEPVREGVASPTVHASYLHVHPAGHPAAVVRLVDAARRRRREAAPGRPSVGPAGHH